MQNRVKAGNIVLVLLIAVTFLQGVLSASTVELTCDTFKYEISSKGKNLAFTDLTNNKNYLSVLEGKDTYCALVEKAGVTHTPSAVEFESSLLKLVFESVGVTAIVKIKNNKTHLVMEVQEVSGNPDSFIFLNVPLTLEALPEEPFAACALSLNLHTRVDELPALHKSLFAACYQRFGFKQARAAVIGVPQKQILPVIREIMRAAAPEIPFSDQGGAWALDAKTGYGSYLMNFGSLTEESVDQWISYCKALGFNQIDNHGSSVNRFFKHGCLELDRKNFPDGWKSFARIVDKLHQAGIASILHTYTCYISPVSHFVTPVPHPDLDILYKFTVAAAVDKNATEIVVNEPTTKVCVVPDYMETSNMTLRIGDEIIKFTDVTQEPPYTFKGCERGYHGTGVAAHQTGAAAGVLKTFWSGLYVPAVDSELFNEIARRTAEVVNECNFDGVYLDAIEGIQYMWGEENYWYYGDKFVFEMMRHMKKPVGLEYAGMVHHWWHYRSRYQAWDMIRRGYKRFVDTRIAAIKSGQEYQHGNWQGYWPDIQRFAPMKDYGLYLPLQLGWWRMHSWQSPQTDNMFLDDIEYVCCKMLGNNAGFSILSSMTPEYLDKFPLFKDFTTMIKQYESLRQQNYFKEDICAQLREPGREFTLFQTGENKWNFKPMVYTAQKVEGVQDRSACWKIENQYASQKLQLRLETLMPVADYDSPENITLVTAEHYKEFEIREAADGVTCRVAQSSERVPATGESALELTAMNQGKTMQKNSWACVSRPFTPALDISNNQGLGVWIKGDGNGQLLDIRLFSKSNSTSKRQSSHYIKMDFAEWRYFTLVEPEATRITDYKWPVNTRRYVYDHHGGRVVYNQVDEVQLWVNDLQPGKESKYLIGPIKALPYAPVTVENPVIILNGKEVVFPVKMQTGMFLELFNDRGCKLYNTRNKVVEDLGETLGEVPLLIHGNNTLSLSLKSDTPDKTRTRMLVTVAAEGKPL